MAVLMFWNLGRNAAAQAIAALCRVWRPDILILAEADMATSDVLRPLNIGDDEAPYWEFRPVPTRVRFFTRYPPICIQQVFDDNHVSIRNLHPPSGVELLVVGVHLPSKLYSSPQEQYYRIRQLRKDIEAAEAQVGHQNSIIIGDLNANPFEDCLVAADGLHGVMDRRVAQRQSRTVQGRAWSFFYNPMWSRMGDGAAGPPGTFYYARSELVSYFWHTFDQVLLRPDLLPFYDDAALSVIERVDGRAILIPGEANPASPDHLPIVVRLDIERGQDHG